jgi:hypothetical protein
MVREVCEYGFYRGGGGGRRTYKIRDVGRKVPRNLSRVDTRVKNVEEGEVPLKTLA